MAKPRRTKNSNTTQLRDFAEPPAEIKQLIEAVAAHVAKNGAHTEFQLRSGSESRHEFHFLHLDDQYAPFYQIKLKEARARRLDKRTGDIPDHSREAAEQLQSDELAVPAPRRNDAMTTRPQNEHGELLYFQSSSYDVNAPASTDQATNKQHDDFRKMSDTKNKTIPLLSQAVNDRANNAQHQPLQHTTADPSLISRTPSQPLRSPPTTPPEPTAHQETIPYGLLQEVHLLDNNGTERSGLTTYLVISNTNPNEQPTNPLVHHLYNSPEPVVDAEPIYRLRPDTSVILRASHSRLLPVGFPLGAEVKQRDNMLPAIIVRRTVERGVRLYDVKDELGVVHQNVQEDMLELHHGGVFDFRLPH